MDPGLEPNTQLGECPLEAPLRNDCARCFFQTQVKCAVSQAAATAADYRARTPPHVGLATALTNKPRTHVCFFHRIFFFWSRGLWPLDQTHLTVSNWANQETIFPFLSFVRVEGWGLRQLLSLVGRNIFPEVEKG